LAPDDLPAEWQKGPLVERNQRNGLPVAKDLEGKERADAVPKTEIPSKEAVRRFDLREFLAPTGFLFALLLLIFITQQTSGKPTQTDINKWTYIAAGRAIAWV
jgi:hypothetical protein